jgi:mannose-6-phosphate isomerase class I
VTVRKGPWGREEIVIGPAQTKFFSFTELNLAGEAAMLRTGFPQVGIVLDGQGELLWEGGSLPVHKGMELFFPYDIPNFRARGNFRMVLCNPEGAEIPMDTAD